MRFRMMFAWLCCVCLCDVCGFEILTRVAADDSTSKRPNILFCISDDQSYPHCSAYGCDWVQTPAFDRVAAGGLLFNNCYTPNAKCAPSRAIILTGRYSWINEAAANHVFFFPPHLTTSFEALNQAGYRIGHTAKGLFPAVSLTAEGEPRFPTGRPYNDRKLNKPTTGIDGTDYAANFTAFLDEGLADNVPARPWCFWYGGREPHRRYEYGSGVAKGGKSTEDVDAVPGYWPDNETVRNDMLDYAYEIEHFDRHLGRMLDELQRRGELDNTLVVVTSDNGMPFPRVKGNAYEQSNHLPLAVMWPDGIQQPGRRIDDFVSFIDFAPTFLDVAGVDHGSTSMQPFSGQSLRPIFESDQEGQTGLGREFILIGKERHDLGRPNDGGYPIRGIVGPRYTYIENFEPDRWPAGNPETGYMNTDGGATKTVILDQRRQGQDVRYWQLCFGKLPRYEFYDRQVDPDCVNNIIDTADALVNIERARLANIMNLRLTESRDPRMLGQGDVFDKYPYAKERVRGFYEKFISGWSDEDGPLKAHWINDTDIEPEPLD